MKRAIYAALIVLFTFAATQAHAFNWSELFGGTDPGVQFKWQDTQGKTFSIAQHKGKPVLVHLWASWCPSCRDELPEYANWLKAHPEVNSLSVSLDSKPEDAIKFLKTNNIDLPVLISDEVQARKLGAKALPTTIVVAADGSIIQHHRGPRNWTERSFSDNLLQSFKIND